MLPSTVLVNILGCLKRRDLDVLELVDRAFGAIIAVHEKYLPRRSLSLTFFNARAVSLVSFNDPVKHVLVEQMHRYLPRSVITKMLFESVRARTWTEEMYQAFLSCRAHLTADAACDFRSLAVFPPDILGRAFTEVFMCKTMVFSNVDCYFDSPEFQRYKDEQNLAALPCIAHCTNLRIANYHEALFDANGALEWLLGTHAAAAGLKRLSIEQIAEKYWDFPSAFIVAIEQQFIHATTPTSFTLELRCSIQYPPGPDVGTTRVLENTVTKEQLEVVVDTPSAFKWKVTMQRKPAA
ncbi:hypothetical protein AAVH_19681 [Aphelenchoides avenae]|nr:hypothetical protein AAVH_19681 [Aphelenchus avenae]